MKIKPKQVTYKDFMEWFNLCPVQILKYEDQVDHLMVTFDLPLCEEEEIEDVEFIEEVEE